MTYIRVGIINLYTIRNPGVKKVLEKTFITTKTNNVKIYIKSKYYIQKKKHNVYEGIKLYNLKLIAIYT